MKNWVLFDLDGTLTDPMLGITSGVKYALSRYGIEVKYLKDLIPFIGPPLKESFMKYYDLTEDEAEQAILYYREYYSPKGLYENKVYPGVQDMLAHLEQAGFDLAVVTTKPTVYAEEILRHFGLREHFTLVVGSEMDGSRTDKAELIEYMLRRAQVNLKDVLMIGDRCHDIAGARQCGVDSIGVLYGYGSREELESAGADYIVESVEQVEEQIFRILQEEQRSVRRIGSWKRNQPEQVESFAFGGRIRFAVVGVGNDAERFCQANRFGRQFELTAVCADKMEEAIAFAGRRGRVTCFDALADLADWDGADAVYLSKEIRDRYSMALQLLTAGKHILCAAPMARTLAQVEELFRVAREQNLILMEGIPAVYAPAYEKMLPYLASLGKVRHASFLHCHYQVNYENWKRGIVTGEFDPDRSDGAGMEMGVYPLALMIRLFGRPDHVRTSMVRLRNGIDITGTILLEYQDMIGEVIYSSVTDSAMPSQIQGEEGSMLISEIDNIKDLRISRRKVDQSIHFEQSDNILHHETNAFIRMIHTGLDQEESQAVSIETMRVLEALHGSDGQTD